MSCESLTKGILFDCSNPPPTGVEDVIYLIAKGDIDTVTFDATNANIITGFTLKTGKQAVKYTGSNQSTQPSWITDESNPYFKGYYQHTVNFVGFDVSQDGRDAFDELAKQRHGFIAVIETKGRQSKGVMNSFEVFGMDNGLHVQAGSGRASYTANDGSNLLQINSSTNVAQGAESAPPADFLSTDYATTKAALEALLTPAA